MALDDIKKTILAEAQKQAEKIKAKGESQAAAAKAGWNKKLEARKTEIIASAKIKADQKVQQAQFKIQAQAQAQILELKQKTIQKVYDEALAGLAACNDEGYVRLMEKLISALPETAGTLVSAAGKENLLKKALQKSGKKYELAAETAKAAGGFVFHSQEMEIDNTFPSLVDDLRDQTGLEVAQVLFGK